MRTLPSFDIVMELSRDYILSYSKYRHVLEECISSLHNGHYPTKDGKLDYYVYLGDRTNL